MRNRVKKGGCSSKYKGVMLDKRRQGQGKTDVWRSYIKKRGKVSHIGFFEREEEAAVAYNLKALELFGEFAKLNEITTQKP